MNNPTIEMTEVLQSAYTYFNNHLFNGLLPECMITLQRKRTAKGYFSQDRFINRQDETMRIHEIALNPDVFTDRSDKEILSTLVHEMVHCWQAEYGLKNPKNAYHNYEWVGKMLAIGLIPYSETTGERGTGNKVTHSVKVFGLFDNVCGNFLATGQKINYQSKAQITAEKAPRKKYTFTFKCPECGDTAKAHRNRNLVCGDCLATMEIVQE
jgi:predicted SprT family Zn-dependent metalloprotease